MRIIVYGLGAVGGVIAAQLTFSGYTVIGIARGTQLEAVRGSGLTLLTPQSTRTAKFAVCADPERALDGHGLCTRADVGQGALEARGIATVR